MTSPFLGHAGFGLRRGQALIPSWNIGLSLFLELTVDGSRALNVLDLRWVRNNLPSKLGAVVKLCSKFLKC